MTLKIFVAREDGNCAICGQNVKGKRSLFNLKKQLVHADCQFKDKVRANANSDKQEAVIPPKRGSPTTYNPSPLDLELRVRARVKTAKRILMEECPEAIETHEYAIMLAEVLHQLFAEESIERIQTAKEKNMERIR